MLDPKGTKSITVSTVIANSELLREKCPAILANIDDLVVGGVVRYTDFRDRLLPNKVGIVLQWSSLEVGST